MSILAANPSATRQAHRKHFATFHSQWVIFHLVLRNSPDKALGSLLDCFRRRERVSRWRREVANGVSKRLIKRPAAGPRRGTIDTPSSRLQPAEPLFMLALLSQIRFPTPQPCPPKRPTK